MVTCGDDMKKLFDADLRLCHTSFWGIIDLIQRTRDRRLLDSLMKQLDCVGEVARLEYLNFRREFRATEITPKNIIGES